MPVRITKWRKNNNGYDTYNLVPAPLVSMSKQYFNNVGRPSFGAEYTVTLQGTLIPNLGNPVYTEDNKSSAFTQNAYWNNYDVSPEELDQPDITPSGYLDATLSKQEMVRTLFSNPIVSGKAKPIKVEVHGWGMSGISFLGMVEDISFDQESRMVNPTTYNVTMKTSSFQYSSNLSDPFASGLYEGHYLDNFGSSSGIHSISSLTENYDIQEDDRRTVTWKTTGAGVARKKTLQSSDKLYSVSRSVTAVGMPIYGNDGEYLYGRSPWKQAQNFVHEYLGIGSGAPGLSGIFASGVQNQAIKGLFNIPGGTSGYQIADFKYQESIDPEMGTYSLNENFLLYRAFTGVPGISFPVIETVTINHDREENERNRISVQGTIQGLNTTSGLSSSGNEYQNALAYWTGYVNSGDLGIHAFQMAKGGSHTGWLHPRPLSKSIINDFADGSISYTMEFDDRPPNMVAGSVSESIQINDTYPGEIFSVTPVIGRSQPVLQYLNSRSEYKRSLSINVVMAENTGLQVNQSHIDGSGFMSDINNRKNWLQNSLLQKKPSITNSQDFATIFWAANPANDPNFVVVDGRCYHSAPTESWDPRTRNYSYNIEWTYERANNI